MEKHLFIDCEGFALRTHRRVYPENLSRQQWALDFLGPNSTTETCETISNKLDVIKDCDARFKMLSKKYPKDAHIYAKLSNERNSRKQELMAELNRITRLNNYLDTQPHQPTIWQTHHRDKAAGRCPKTILATEVSCVVFDSNSGAIEHCLYHRLTYDLKDHLELNKKTINFAFKHYPNTLRNKIKFDGHAPDETRARIFEIVKEYDIKKIFAKGPFFETTWLFYPESCDGYSAPLSLPQVGFISDCFCDKFDFIQDRHDTVARLIGKLEPSDDIDKLPCKKFLQAHFSLAECLVFVNEMFKKTFCDV